MSEKQILKFLIKPNMDEVDMYSWAVCDYCGEWCNPADGELCWNCGKVWDEEKVTQKMGPSEEAKLFSLVCAYPQGAVEMMEENPEMQRVRFALNALLAMAED